MLVGFCIDQYEKHDPYHKPKVCTNISTSRMLAGEEYTTIEDDVSALVSNVVCDVRCKSRR